LPSGEVEKLAGAFATASLALNRATYPPSHPYSGSVLGNVADIEALTLADARDHHKACYQPANATLVVAGDIDVSRTREWIEKYFGSTIGSIRGVSARLPRREVNISPAIGHCGRPSEQYHAPAQGGPLFESTSGSFLPSGEVEKLAGAFATASLALNRATYPPSHPYSGSVLGNVADIEALTLADARDHHKACYQPANATLVVAGDIDVSRTREWIEKYFGSTIGSIRGVSARLPRREVNISPAIGHCGRPSEQYHAPAQGRL
jgi:predicted Zn-dependent peptidase